MGGKVSSLDIETEDMVELLMKFESGVHAELHINYLNRTRIREFIIIGEKGIIRWDSSEGDVKYFDSAEQCWKTYREPFEFHINDTYVSEMQHFISCIQGKETSLNDAREGRGVMEIVENAKKSLNTQMPIKM
jgi:predicted dehydrogenase